MPLRRVLSRGYEQPLSRPEHVRRALEELGPPFIKLGQILSTRADLLPPIYQLELAKLQDAAPPLKTDLVRSIIESEFGSGFAARDDHRIASRLPGWELECIGERLMADGLSIKRKRARIHDGILESESAHVVTNR